MDDAIKENNIQKLRDNLKNEFFDRGFLSLEIFRQYMFDKKDALITAINNRVDEDIFDILIQNGVDVDFIDDDKGESPLYLAVIAEPGKKSSDGKVRNRDYYLKVIKLLIRNGASPFLRNRSGTTPLEEAKKIPDNKDIISFLEETEKNFSSHQDFTNIIDNVDDEDYEKVSDNLTKILEENPNVLSIRHGDGDNGIFYVIKYFYDTTHLGDILEIMYNKKKDIINEKLFGESPIMVFIQRYPNPSKNILEVFEKLLVMITDANEVNYRNYLGETMLDYALKLDNASYASKIREYFPDAKKGKELGKISDKNSIFFGETEIELDSGGSDVPSTPSTPRTPSTPSTPRTPSPIGTPERPPDIRADHKHRIVAEQALPDDKKELKELLLKELQESQVGTKGALKTVDKILHKMPELVNEPIGEPPAPPIFSIFGFNKEDDIDIFLSNLLNLNVDPIKTNSDGVTVFEKSIEVIDSRFIFEHLVLIFGVEKLITSPEQIPVLYEKIYEEHQKNIKNPENKFITSEMLIWMFDQSFYIIISSDSDDNYKWLPKSVSSDIINDNLLGLNLVTSGVFQNKAIKNDEKIFDFIMKKNPDINLFIQETKNPRTPLEEAIFRTAPAKPSSYMVEKLLIDGAELKFRDEGENAKEFKDMLYYKDSEWNLFDNQEYTEEYKKITALLYQALAIQLILMTPFINPKINADLMLKQLIQHHPEAFTYYPKPPLPEGTVLKTQEIDPNDEVFDVIMQSDEKISEFLEEDKDNHIVLQDYDKPDTKFLFNINDIKKAIAVDTTPLERYQYDEEVGPEREEQTEGVSGPGKKGGRAIVFPCHGFTESFNIQMSKVNNMEPYVNFNNISMVGGGLVPLLEVYDKILTKKVDERGQYFSYKVLAAKVDPIAGVSVINFDNKGENRYGGQINVVSASHCQEGQYGNIMTIIPAKEKSKVTLGGRKKNKTTKKGRKSKNSKSKNSKNSKSKTRKAPCKYKTINKKRVKRSRKRTLRKPKHL